MGIFPNKSDIVEAVLNGIVKAYKTNLKWTRKQAWLSVAPEYMINIFIGQSLATLKPMPEIWFEVGINDLTDSINLNENKKEEYKKGIERNDHKKEKIDIVLDDEKNSRVIIEVKNRVTKYDHIKKDVERICNAFKVKSTLKYGVIAFFANISSSRSIEDLIYEMDMGMKNTIQKNAFKIKPIKLTNIIELDKDKIDGWSCVAICFILEPM